MWRVRVVRTRGKPGRLRRVMFDCVSQTFDTVPAPIDPCLWATHNYSNYSIAAETVRARSHSRSKALAARSEAQPAFRDHLSPEWRDPASTGLLHGQMCVIAGSECKPDLLLYALTATFGLPSLPATRMLHLRRIATRADRVHGSDNINPSSKAHETRQHHSSSCATRNRWNHHRM